MKTQILKSLGLVKARPAWSWICQTCSDGMTQRATTSTYHHGVCHWCEMKGPVTSSRDFGYPKLPKGK